MKEQSYTSTPPVGRTAAIVDEMELPISSTTAASNSNGLAIFGCMYNFVLLMMGGGTA
jgi:hypothetical protein